MLLTEVIIVIHHSATGLPTAAWSEDKLEEEVDVGDEDERGTQHGPRVILVDEGVALVEPVDVCIVLNLLERVTVTIETEW